MKKHKKQEYRKYKITEVCVNGYTTELEVRYLCKPDGTINMSTKCVIDFGI